MSSLANVRMCPSCKSWDEPRIDEFQFLGLPVTQAICVKCQTDIAVLPTAKSRKTPAVVSGVFTEPGVSLELSIPPGKLRVAIRLRMESRGRVVLQQQEPTGWEYALAHTHDADGLWDLSDRPESVRLSCVSLSAPIEYYLSFHRLPPDYDEERWEREFWARFGIALDGTTASRG